MSKRRFRPTDAFVDESIRGQRYWMSCVLIEVRNLAALRAETAALAAGLWWCVTGRTASPSSQPARHVCL